MTAYLSVNIKGLNQRCLVHFSLSDIAKQSIPVTFEGKTYFVQKKYLSDAISESYEETLVFIKILEEINQFNNIYFWNDSDREYFLVDKETVKDFYSFFNVGPSEMEVRKLFSPLIKSLMEEAHPQVHNITKCKTQGYIMTDDDGTKYFMNKKEMEEL